MHINNLTIPQAPSATIDTTQLFKDKKVILFGLPGAFTPTCSSKQLPGYEEMFSKFQEKGILEIYCVSVNDGFVMSNWFKNQEIKNYNRTYYICRFIIGFLVILSIYLFIQSLLA